MLIISTKPYSDKEVRQIIDIRAEEEDVEMGEESKELLTKIGMETSLRYSIHLISISNLCAQKRKSQTVEVSDIQRCFHLFVDVKRSTEFLTQFNDEFMFSEVQKEDEEGMEITSQ
jgi:RuvB-like protein 2